jgi:hypothetical protein
MGHEMLGALTNPPKDGSVVLDRLQYYIKFNRDRRLLARTMFILPYWLPNGSRPGEFLNLSSRAS